MLFSYYANSHGLNQKLLSIIPKPIKNSKKKTIKMADLNNLIVTTQQQFDVIYLTQIDLSIKYTL